MNKWPWIRVEIQQTRTMCVVFTKQLPSIEMNSVERDVHWITDVYALSIFLQRQQFVCLHAKPTIA